MIVKRSPKGVTYVFRLRGREQSNCCFISSKVVHLDIIWMSSKGVIIVKPRISKRIVSDVLEVYRDI